MLSLSGELLRLISSFGHCYLNFLETFYDIILQQDRGVNGNAGGEANFTWGRLDKDSRNPAAVAPARLGAKKGGKARAEKLLMRASNRLHFGLYTDMQQRKLFNALLNNAAIMERDRKESG